MKATLWPVQIDVFIAIGELALVVAMVRQWGGRWRVGAGAVTGIGLAVSVAANVGHVTAGNWTSHASAAVAPMAAAVGLTVGLAVLKLVAAQTPDTDTRADTGADIGADTGADTGPAPVQREAPAPQPRRAPAGKAPKPTGRRKARAAAIYARDPGITGADLAKRVGIEERTGQRWRSEFAAGKTVAAVPDPASRQAGAAQ